MTPGGQPAATGSRAWLKWWALILIGLLAGAAGVVTVLVLSIRPAFASVDELDVGRVKGMTAFVLNRPDGGPDVAHPKAPLVVPPAEYDRVLGLLRNAEPVKKDRGVFLGELRVKLAEGRTQSIQLYRATAGPKDPAVLRFKIEQHQYEAGPADRLVSLLAELEGRAKAGP